ncbi:MAG: DUF2085 domain-containing protein [Coriobacteriales bacterium]|nr:DUF2085 domain-containing protein [Coriobacteriales bacterium]
MLDAFFRAFGFGLCHQLPERSFFGGGVQLPVCARDTGIYVGFIVGALVIYLLHRPKRPGGFPDALGWVTISLLFGLMVADGVTSYAGLRATTNVLRLLSGVSAGFSIAAVVVPLLNEELWATSDPERVLTPPWKLAVWVLCVPVTSLAVWFVGPMFGVAYPFLVTLAILATFTSVNMVFAALLPAFDRSARRLRDLIGPVCIGLLLTIIEIFGAAMLRIALDSLAARLV